MKKKIAGVLCACLITTGSLFAQPYDYSPAPVQGTRTGMSLTAVGIGVLAAAAIVAIVAASDNGGASSHN